MADHFWKTVSQSPPEPHSCSPPATTATATDVDTDVAEGTDGATGSRDDLLVREGDVAGDYLERLLDILDVDGDSAQAGDWVLVHVGFALSKVDEQEAIATRKLLEAMGADYEQELEELRQSLIE